jgi:hypothetical protein
MPYTRVQDSARHQRVGWGVGGGEKREQEKESERHKEKARTFCHSQLLSQLPQARVCLPQHFLQPAVLGLPQQRQVLRQACVLECCQACCCGLLTAPLVLCCLDLRSNMVKLGQHRQHCLHCICPMSA